jgi:hypothetical protein
MSLLASNNKERTIMNDFIINESNVKDICAEIIAGLMNMRVLPHDVTGETFERWTSIVEKQIRYEAHNSSFVDNLLT